jgi:nucleotide-binding universal stress UspA family protein
MYEHVLVALDGSAPAERVMAHAEAFAMTFKSTITLIRATVSAETLIAETASASPLAGEVAPPIDPTPIVEGDHEDALQYLERMARRLRTHGVTVTTELPQGPADEEIVARAKDLKVNLIMMTTHGRGGLGRMLFGSIADKVLRRASCPVLIIRINEDEPLDVENLPQEWDSSIR